ncbi:hypothetical protein AVEN_235177-1, partial [Araneus ventricosus]
GSRYGLYRRFQVTLRTVGETIKGPSSDHGVECVLIDYEHVGRLGSPLECERVWNLSLEFYPLGELISCESPSGVQSVVAVLISELLYVSVANLCKCCFYCYLRFA